MNPGLVGVPQRRLARLDGRTLELLAEEHEATSGRSRLHRIAWRRPPP
jgi:hypothetical protein